jgi:hypothetical protein
VTDELSEDREEVGQVGRPLILIGVEPGADQTDVGKSVVRMRAAERNGETTSAARKSTFSFIIFFIRNSNFLIFFISIFCL